MIFIPRSIESQGHHEKSPAVRNFILTAGLFLVPPTFYYFLDLGGGGYFEIKIFLKIYSL